jgi:hypothetical protein
MNKDSKIVYFIGSGSMRISNKTADSIFEYIFDNPDAMFYCIRYDDKFLIINIKQILYIE